MWNMESAASFGDYLPYIRLFPHVLMVYFGICDISNHFWSFDHLGPFRPSLAIWIPRSLLLCHFFLSGSHFWPYKALAHNIVPND